MNAPGMLIRIQAPAPAEGFDGAEDNPLARATRNLLGQGQSILSAAPVIFRVSGTDSDRWLGIFVKTEASRMLFFPGFSKQHDRVQHPGERGRGRLDRPLVMDHITLERDRRTWHFTQRGGAVRQGGPATFDLGEGRVLWFGLTTPTPSHFRQLRATTEARAPRLRNGDEMRRRVGCFNAAMGDAGISRIMAPVSPPTEQVLHFVVIVAPRGAPLYAGPKVAWYAPIATVDGTHTFVPFGPEDELQILAMWMPEIRDERGVTFECAEPGFNG